MCHIKKSRTYCPLGSTRNSSYYFNSIKSNRFSEDRATSLIARKGATCNSLGAGIVRCMLFRIHHATNRRVNTFLGYGMNDDIPELRVIGTL
jgi:hypothetical protein